MIETCINHPTKTAIARCKTCHRPLCNECKMVTEMGIFCGEQCYERTKQFTARVERLPMPRRRAFAGLMRFVKKLILLAMLLAIAYGAITLFSGTPENLIEQIKRLIKLLFR